MFKKLKASLGIGGATVDTVLHNESLYQGETLRGTVNIKGGGAEQEIDAITLKLCTEVKVESDSGVSYQHLYSATFALTIHLLSSPAKKSRFRLSSNSTTKRQSQR